MLEKSVLEVSFRIKQNKHNVELQRTAPGTIWARVVVVVRILPKKHIDGICFRIPLVQGGEFFQFLKVNYIAYFGWLTSKVKDRQSCKIDNELIVSIFR